MQRFPANQNFIQIGNFEGKQPNNFYEPYLSTLDMIAIAMFSFDQFYWAEKMRLDQHKLLLVEIKARPNPLQNR